MKNYEIEINGETYHVGVKELAADAEMTTSNESAKPASSATPTPTPVTTTTGAEVKAPMPGTILSVSVSPGQIVAQGDVLAVLEAMKMENEIIAAADGVVNEILVNASDSVQSDQVLFIM